MDVFVQDLETLAMREREVYQISEFNRFYAVAFGGDDLFGGEGPDRFLVQPGDVVHEPANEDALLTMKNSQGLVKFTYKGGSFEYEGKSWTDNEIQQVDSALRAMHLRVGNTSLLKTANGNDMTLIRGGNSSLSNASATNIESFGQPAIIFFKGTFNDGITWTRLRGPQPAACRRDRFARRHLGKLRCFVCQLEFG